MGDDRGRAALSEPLLPRVIAGIRPAWLELGGVAGTLLVAAASFAQGAWRAGCFALGAALTAVAVAVRAYQEARGRRERELWEEAQGDRTKNLVSNLNMAAFRVRAAMSRGEKRKREAQLQGARMLILELARNLMGAHDGTRAHYFQVESTERLCLVAPEWGVAGSAVGSSKRVITAEDESLKKALRGEGRLIGDTRELPEGEGSLLPYGSFVVAPVFAGYRLYGILTVDSRGPGDLGELDKEALVNLASTLAMTFLDQRDIPYIDMTSVEALTRIEPNGGALGGDPQ